MQKIVCFDTFFVFTNIKRYFDVSDLYFWLRIFPIDGTVPSEKIL